MLVPVSDNPAPSVGFPPFGITDYPVIPQITTESLANPILTATDPASSQYLPV